MSENLKIRMLSSREELYKLKQIYRDNDSKQDPRRSLLTAAIVETPDERIVGMLGFELVPHVGPLFIKEDYRGKGYAEQMYRLIDEQLPKDSGTGYYTFPSNDVSKHIALKLGLEKLPWEVWKREF